MQRGGTPRRVYLYVWVCAYEISRVNVGALVLFSLMATTRVSSEGDGVQVDDACCVLTPVDSKRKSELNTCSCLSSTPWSNLICNRESF